jgi:hypothetical protein
MTVSTFRPISIDERALIQRLLSEPFPGSAEIGKQLDTALVRKIDAEGSLEFNVAEQAQAMVVHRVPVEGTYCDRDGLPVHLLLHVIDGRARELEIFKADGSEISTPATPDALTLTHAH